MLTSLFSLLRTHFFRLISMGMIFAVVILMITLVDQIISNIDQQIATQTKPIVAADMIIQSSQAITGEDSVSIKQLISANNKDNIILQSVEFYTTIGQSKDPKLVQVKGIQQGYPLYGELEIGRITDASLLTGKDGSVNPLFTGRIDVSQQGVYMDSQTYNLINQSGFIQLGSLNLPVLGIIQKQATLGFNFLDEGRTILMPYELVAATKLTDIGSRVSHQLQVKLVDESQGPTIKKQIEAQFGRTYNVSLASGRVSQLSGIIDQLTQYTSILLIITLILSLTIMSIATMTMTDRIKQSIAVMRILGLTKTKILLLSVLLFGSMFVIGSMLGYILSYTIFSQLTHYEVAKDFVRQTGGFWKIAIIAITSFVMTCWLPLRYVVDTHPLTLLKSTETQISHRDRIIGFLLFIVGSLLILFLLTKKLLFSLLVVVLFLLLIFLFSYCINLLFRSFLSRFQNYRTSHFGRYDAIRQTILPGNQTALLVGSLLVSLLAYGVITSMSLSFIDRLRISSIDQPNIFVLNVKNSDIATIESFDTGARLYDSILARIQSINGVSLSDYLDARGEQGGERREFTREFNTTTRPLANSPIIKGDPLQPGGLSLDETFAKSLGLKIGDRLTIFIQGRTFDLSVTSLRKRISSGSEPFFYLQLDAEQFREAPRSWFRVTRTTDVPSFKQQALEKIGNHISFIDIEAIITLVTDIAEKVITIVLVCMALILFLILCVSIASNESSAILSQQSYRLYHILGMPKKGLFQKSWKIVSIYAVVIVVLVIALLPFLLWNIYNLAPLLTRTWSSFLPLIAGIFGSLFLMVMSYVWFHKAIIRRI